MNQPRSSIILYFISRYKLRLGVVITLSLSVSILESLGVAAFFPVFAFLIGQSEEGPGGILGVVTGLVSIMPFTEPIVSASVFLIVVYCFKTVMTLTRDWFAAIASGKILYEMKRQVMDTHSAAQYQFFLENSQGRLIYNGLAAPIGVSNLMMIGTQLLSQFLKFIAIFVVLAMIFPIAALVVGVIGLIYYCVMHYLSKRISYVLGQTSTNADTQLLIIANEFLNGIHQMITFRAVRFWNERFDRENRIFCEAYVKNLIWTAVPRPIMEMVGVSLISAIILTLWLVSPAGFTETLPKLGVFAVAMVQLLPTITGFGQGRMTLMSQLPKVERVYDTIAGSVPMRGDGFRDLVSFNDALIFEKASFAHKGREALLDEVDLVIEKGKVTAIVGPSGHGKTTILNLILGLFDPTAGRITVDGVPLQEIKHEAWLGKIGFVSQEPFTYNSTVADNILLGRDFHSIESIIESARIANAHGFISELPQGYNTFVGERGMQLSGGEQQRIAIARAVLDQPEILIFDEATSSLDTISERLVQEAIDNVSVDRTVIIVAHRLSTIRRADKIIVLDQGQVLEEGTHEELLDRNGEYAHMVALTR